MNTDRMMYGSDPLKSATTLAEMGAGEMDWLRNARSIKFRLTPIQRDVEIRDMSAFGAVLLSARSRGLLFVLRENPTINREDVEGLVEGYDDLRAFAHVLAAGLASDSDQGITITPIGRYTADALFGDRAKTVTSGHLTSSEFL